MARQRAGRRVSGIEPPRRWWLRLLRGWLIHPRFRKPEPYDSRGALARVVQRQAGNSVTRLLVEGPVARLRRFDWPAFVLFLVAAGAEVCLVWSLGRLAAVWFPLSFIVMGFVVGGLSCVAAMRVWRRLERVGMLQEMRTLPLRGFEVDTALLAIGAAPALAGTMVGTAAASVAIGVGAWNLGPVVAVILISMMAVLRTAVAHAAMRYGLYFGWRRAADAFAEGEPIPGGASTWLRGHGGVALLWLIVMAGLAAAALAVPDATFIGKLIARLTSGFLLLSPVLAGAWVLGAEQPDFALDEMERQDQTRPKALPKRQRVKHEAEKRN